MTAPASAIFVYGTLKQCECRATCWPREPIEIIPATVRGLLYDLGPYPALYEGEGRVAGELWKIRPTDMAITLQVLDRIECDGADGVDLYIRKVVPCSTATGQVFAHAYILADRQKLEGLSPIRSPFSRPASWPDPAKQDMV